MYICGNIVSDENFSVFVLFCKKKTPKYIAIENKQMKNKNKIKLKDKQKTN